MAGGLPVMFMMDSNNNPIITTEGMRVQSSNSFKYLDFLRHQINAELQDAQNQKRQCEEGYKTVERNYEQGKKKFDKILASGNIPSNIDELQRELTGWDTHPANVYWSQPYQQGILNRIRILEASRDLVVSRMNSIGSRY